MPALLTPTRSAQAERMPDEGSGGRPSLEDILDSAWRELRAGRAANCAVCGDRMDPEPGARGRCRSCGSTLG